jgi:hypothetical protein
MEEAIRSTKLGGREEVDGTLTEENSGLDNRSKKQQQ